MGLKPCPEVQEKIDDGYLCLVVIDPSKSAFEPTDFVSNENMGKMHRTGEIMYMRREAFAQIFEGNDMTNHVMTFIDLEVADQLKKMDNVQHV